MKAATVIFALLALLSTVAQAQINSGIIRVLRTEGSVEITTPQGDAITARRGMTLAPGSRIETGEGGSVLVVFSNGGTLIVDERSTVELSEFSQMEPVADTNFLRLNAEPNESVTRIRLLEGALITEIKGLNPASTYEINTPISSCGIRGSRNFSSYSENQPERIREANHAMLTGMAEVRLLGTTESQEVSGGESVKILIQEEAPLEEPVVEQIGGELLSLIEELDDDFEDAVNNEIAGGTDGGDGDQQQQQQQQSQDIDLNNDSTDPTPIFPNP